MKPKQIDQISFVSGVLTISGWAQAGPPQSISYDGRIIYQRRTINVSRPDVAVYCGNHAAGWGFSTDFDGVGSDFDPEKLLVTFPDGGIIAGASVHRVFIRIEAPRFVAPPVHLTTARAPDWIPSETLRNLANNVWGEQRFHTTPPRVESHFNAHLVPVIGFPDNDPCWGVYEAEGGLVDAAAHKRGPGRVLLGQSETMPQRTDFRLVDEVAVYGGLTVPHFGHYLLSTLSRHWKNWKDTFPGTKIYMHTMEPLDGWLARPFVRQTMTALGYEASDFAAIDAPMRVRHLIVPAAGFVEQCEAYQPFGEIGRQIGERLWQGGSPRVRSEPVYLSKERLRGGVWSVANEADLSRHLRAAGVRIVYPETLSLAEQVRVFAEHRTVIGLAGSALHACLFSAGGHRLIAVNSSEYLNSNFILLDKMKGNLSTYATPTSGMERVEFGPDFNHGFIIPDSTGVARDLLRLAA